MKKLLLLKCKLVLCLIISSLSIQAQKNCDVDTINYTYLKTSTFRPVSLNASSSGNSFAQWFPAPQAITIEGFDFYAWQSANTSDTVSLTCNLYRAGADSLPTGAPLRSVTIDVDSTFGGGQIARLIKKAIFGSPITVNFAYIVTVENTTSTNVSVLANDYAATSPNGRSEWLSSVRIGANYIRGYNINVGGIPFNADFVFRPHVKYTIKTDFTFVGCNSATNTISFKNNHSAVFSSPFYNRYAFYNVQRICHRWNYGDNGGSTSSINGSKKYNIKADYNVTLYDTLYGWFNGCADSLKKTVYATPNPPKVNNNSPVCSGDSLKLSVDTVSGTTYAWAAPTSPFINSPDTVIVNSDTSLNGIYNVVALKNGCPSFSVSTTVVVNQTPEPPIASNDGAKCVGDDAKFEITAAKPFFNYYWSGPNGFTSIATSFDFKNVDTTLRGDYIVYAEDGMCKSAPDTVDLFIYPPPQPPVVSAKNAIVCERDSLYLIGTSLPGVLFSWTGPNGFTSAATNPAIASASMTNAGVYKAFIKVGSCSSTADSVTVTVNPSPTATITTNSTTFCDGDSTTIMASTATGLTYKWQKDSNDIPNAIGENFTAKTTGSYRAIVTNTFACSDVSTDINIIARPLPTVTQHPQQQLAGKDWNVTFEVTSPDVGVGYQWQEDRGTGYANLNNISPYAGVTTKTLTVNNVNDAFNKYKYRCVLTLAGCETISNDGVLTINVSVGKLGKNNALKLYPNPTNSILNINLELDNPQEVSYTIIDVLGKEYTTPQTFMANSQQQHTINVSQLPKGIYFIKLKAGTIEKVARFIVE
jgi:hypothetical protein